MFASRSEADFDDDEVGDDIVGANFRSGELRLAGGRNLGSCSSQNFALHGFTLQQGNRIGTLKYNLNIFVSSGVGYS